jgi:hypothetical protein
MDAFAHTTTPRFIILRIAGRLFLTASIIAIDLASYAPGSASPVVDFSDTLGMRNVTGNLVMPRLAAGGDLGFPWQREFVLRGTHCPAQFEDLMK